jgi:hypothetical protein
MSSAYPVLGQLRAARESDGKRQAPTAVDLEVRAGQLLAWLGPHGALLLGWQRPDAGQMSLFGMDRQRLAVCRQGVPDALLAAFGTLEPARAVDDDAILMEACR